MATVEFIQSNILIRGQNLKMSIKEIKKLQSEKGFTIVELLIVIVVIGILAAIVIVAFNGITQQANANAAKANAQSVAKVADTFNTECPKTTACASVSGYPSEANLRTYSGASNATAKLPAAISADAALIQTTLSATHADGKTIQYLVNATNTGTCVGYWNQSTGAAEYIYAGAASNGQNIATPTCS